MKRLLLLLIMAVTLMFIPNYNFGQVINLGTTADFVLFSSVGAVTNTGISQVTGNVGSNLGASTGFGNVNGVMHDQDLASGQCAADLLIAYADLAAAIPTDFPAVLLGNGQILNAGVYSIAAPATLNLDLTLDALGDPNAVFIFQIGGAFSSGANAKVELINGAQACNVYWKIEGMVDLATGTKMCGTIIANNSAININTGDTIQGRALAINGAITIDGILAYTPIGCGSPVLTGPLAPDLVSALCYTIFSSDGPVINAGVTYVTGDVGTNLGLTTGFNPLFVTGAIHPIPDGSTVAAAADLLNAYSYMNTLPYDIELLYPPLFGNDLVLTPHTYLMNGAVTFTDNLYLDGQDNVDAVFVIKIYGALSTEVYANVILINGTKPENVYWFVNGAVNIGDYTEFVGTIVCNNGAMDLLQGVNLIGRALTTVGAISTNAITATAPPGCVTASSPIIVDQPTDQIVCDGGAAVFTVAASGTGLTYQWRIGLVDLVDGGNISGATTSTLTIDPASIADVSAIYNVVVSGSSLPDVISNDVSLSLGEAPIITIQPTDQSACVGSPVSFTVTATGTDLTYQWRIGIVNLIDDVTISGSTTNTLTIDPVGLTDAALDYNVVVSGLCLPDAISDDVALSLGEAPIITIQPTNQSACVGSPVSFTVTATGTDLTYQWRIGIVNLIDGATISGATTNTLTIDPVSLTDVALDYNVVVSGLCLPDAISDNVSLDLGEAPIITIQPTNQSACVGSPVSFTVTATGTDLTYQWRIGIIDLVDGVTISGAATNTLTIDPANLTDVAIDYNVVVSGSCLPDAISDNVSLSLGEAPIITVQPTDQSTCVGSPVSFTVTATGTDLTYQWRIGTVDLIDGVTISGAATNTLTIDPINLTDVAIDYNVVVSGLCLPDAISDNVSLSLGETPIITVQPTDQSACAGSPASFTVTATGTDLTYQWRIGTVNLADGLNISGVNTASLTIDPTTFEDELDNYNVVISGTCPPNVTSQNASLAIDSLPVAAAITNSPVCLGSSILLTAGTIEGASYEWSNAEGYLSADQISEIPNAQISDSGTYSLVVTHDGCVSEPLNLYVITEQCNSILFHIPEGFSPNLDNVNDVFVITGIDHYPKNTIIIFNRWGNKVFEASPYNNDWNGKSQFGLRVGGEELPVGTYFYVLDLGDGSDEYKGTIYLNR